MKPPQGTEPKRVKSELVHKEMEKLATEFSLPESVRSDSERICDSIMRNKLMRRRSFPVIAASSLYTACRENFAPVTIKDLAAATELNPKEIGRCYRSIISRMNITPPNLDGANFAARVAEAVHASDDATRLSVEVVRNAIRMGLGGRNPMTLAAAAVYLACLTTGENSRQSDVADAAGVSEVSVRECVKAVRRAGVV
jgi:transcription initiation factor TFIIB